MPPIRVLHFAHGRGDRERFRRGRLAHESEAGLVREPVSLEGVDLLLRPNEVLERVAAAAVPRDDVVQVAAILADEFAGVLADALVALEERSNRLPSIMTLPMMLFIMPTIFLIVGGPVVLRMMDVFAR